MSVITWSYSGMKSFQGCQRRYHEVNVLKNFPFVDTPETIYGKEVHSAIEDFINDGVCLPESYSGFKSAVDKINRIDGIKYCELKMGVLRDGEPCDFYDKAAWVRGIADLIIISSDGRKAIIIDWKTGSHRYPDHKQLELMFLLLCAKFPDIEEFDCYLVFLAHGVRVNARYTKNNTGEYWDYWEGEYKKLEAAFEAQTFPPRPTKLCGWCPVSSCQYHPGGRKA